MIQDEAVQAALNASLTFKNQRGMDNAANLMWHILEAAAPHMMERAYNAGHLDGMNGAPNSNPYGTAK